MKKCLKTIGLICMTCSLLMVSPVSFGGTNVVQKGVAIGQVISDISGLMQGFPILDITSVPSHAVVAMEQEFIRMRTDVENEVKNQIKGRITATKNNVGQVLDTQMSNAKILSNEANKLVEEGIVGKGILMGEKGEIEKDAEKSTFDLSMQQQANWTSAAGSLRAKDAYAKKRAYIEQEQAVRLLGTIGVLRKNIKDNFLGENGPMKQLADNYEKSDVKKDLDPAQKGEASGENALNNYQTVAKTNDYNQAFRQYAFNGLVYDQLLSLEQQILGLRLQAIAGKSAQDMSPLSDKLDVNAQADEAKAGSEK